MEKIVIIAFNIFLTIINIALSYYCIGLVLDHWNLYYLVEDFYNLKAYFAFNFIVGIIISSTNAKVALIETKIKILKEDKLMSIKRGFTTTLSILIIFLFSFVLSTIIQ